MGIALSFSGPVGVLRHRPGLSKRPARRPVTVPPTLPRAPESGVVRLMLVGDIPDVLQAALFIEGVLAGEDPAASLGNARLDGIKIAWMKRSPGVVTYALHLEEAE
jgi:hypothetical protein